MKNRNVLQRIVRRCWNFLKKELINVVGKREGLEEELMGNTIKDITYRKWFAILPTERANREAKIKPLLRDITNIIDQLEKALPILKNPTSVYRKLSVSGKHLFLNKVFQRGLIYDGKVVRTPYIHPALSHKIIEIKEKRPLIIEQPSEKNTKNDRCTAYGNRTRDSSVKGMRLNPLTNAA